MIRLIRIAGMVLVVAGILTVVTWFIEPLRAVWPHLHEWFNSLPIPIRLGLLMAAIGFVLMFSSIIWERVEDSKNEGSLLDDD